jgi:hypothetical protein
LLPVIACKKELLFVTSVFRFVTLVWFVVEVWLLFIESAPVSEFVALGSPGAGVATGEVVSVVFDVKLAFGSGVVGGGVAASGVVVAAGSGAAVAAGALLSTGAVCVVLSVATGGGGKVCVASVGVVDAFDPSVTWANAPEYGASEKAIKETIIKSLAGNLTNFLSLFLYFILVVN